MTKKQVRHGRILSLREKIKKGWNMEQLEKFCKTSLKVHNATAKSYIDEASLPFRKKWRSNN